MTKTNQNFEIWAGDRKIVQFGISASDGTGQDLTGNTASWIIQDEFNSTCVLSQVDGTVSGSIVSVALSASDTSALDGYYYHELSSTASGSPTTLAVGTVQVNRSSI